MNTEIFKDFINCLNFSISFLILPICKVYTINDESSMKKTKQKH